MSFNKAIDKRIFMNIANKRLEKGDDLFSIYITAEDTFKKYHSEDGAKYGHEFNVPVDNGSFLKFAFYEDRTVLTGINEHGNERVFIDTLGKSVKEVQDILDDRTKEFEFYDAHIGTPPGKAFINTLNDLAVGETITTNTGKMLCLDKKNGLELSFKGIRQGLNDITIEHFKDEATYNVDLTNPGSVRNFASRIRNVYNNTLELRFGNIKNSKRELENKLMLTPKGSSVSITIGDEKIIGNKPKLGKPKWFDSKGNKISLNTAARYSTLKDWSVHMPNFRGIKMISNLQWMLPFGF